MGPNFKATFHLILILLFYIVQQGDASSNKKAHAAKEMYAHDMEQDFEDFCDSQKQLRADPDSIKRDCKRINEKDFHKDDLHILLMLFVIILYGAGIRTVLRTFKINLPYTVVLMFSGIVLGVIARYQCFSLYPYSAIARIKPDVVLFAFLPVLIFETAFGISAHVFMKASLQIILAAFPGMLLSTSLTAMLCYQFFADYGWSFTQALFFGSLISATDPVAVVNILKEVGVAESLSVIIDGESLLNDGVAILLFEIFKDLLQTEEEETASQIAGNSTVMFIRIAIGGPIFGFGVAKISIFCLSKIFNDAIVEITITLVSAYLTYYLAEAVLGVSGVCAVVLLGITMSNEKTCVSPDIIEEVHEFWEMAAHLANTVLFFYTGIVISERGSRDLSAVDVYYLILFYVAINFIRFVMLVVLSPLLSRCGYGLTWQNLMVMVWGGLRGSVGICLSLQIYEDPLFCNDKKFGPKVLFLTAGIVFLTLMINGTTTKKLLDVLGLTAITPGQIDEMTGAVKHIMETAMQGIARLKHDRYLSDANWDYIYKFTELRNPYKDVHVKSRKPKPASSILYMHEGSHKHPCPACLNLVENEPSNEEYRVMTEEARLRVLKALKITYWAQYDQGIISEEAVKILVAVTEAFTDIELAMIHTIDLEKFWKIHGILPRIRTKMMAHFGPTGKLVLVFPPKPNRKCRFPFWWLVTRSWFDTAMAGVVLVNFIPIIWEFIIDIDGDAKNDGYCGDEDRGRKTAFLVINIGFTMIYFLEFLSKVIGLGCKGFCSNKWNTVDCVVLFISLLDLGLGFTSCDGNSSSGYTRILKGLRILRLFRSVRLIKFLIPVFINILNGRINKQMFFGYDVAVGYLTAVENVLKLIPHLVENYHVSKKIRAHLERQRTEVLKQINLIQREHPGIALAVKTRHCSRKVLNQMRNALEDLRMDGLLDEKENSLLTIALEERMKRLWTSPSYIPPTSPDLLVKNLSWVYGLPELKDFVFSNADLLKFQAGDVIASVGDEPNGIYVVVTGMVKITYEPMPLWKENRQYYGAIPNVEIFRDFDFDKPDEDFFSSGSVIGESGLLTRRPRSGTVSCESEEVTAYYIPMSIMEDAMEKFNEPYNSLESRLWRSCGIRRIAAFLPTTSFYYNWSPEKIQMHIERSCVPLGDQFEIFEIPPYVLDIFVIEGVVEDYVTGNLFVAPSLVARSCTRLVYNIDNPKTVNRILLITQDNIGTPAPEDEIAKCVVASYSCRRGMMKEASKDDVWKGLLLLHVNFTARLKGRRRSTYTEDDDKKTKDETLRRRATIVPTRTGEPEEASSSI